MSPERFSENRKGAGTNSGESGARNLEAECIRNRAESTGGRVKLKTVTEIRLCIYNLIFDYVSIILSSIMYL